MTWQINVQQWATIDSAENKFCKKIYSKEKVAEYYLQNKKAIKGKSKNWYKNLSKEDKTRLKSIKDKDINNWFSTKKKHCKINEFFSTV